jgi:hypothetical protein
LWLRDWIFFVPSTISPLGEVVSFEKGGSDEVNKEKKKRKLEGCEIGHLFLTVNKVG